ncbi:ChbG/HpnK family deacetylase [uncultured Traorella sp.]|uniref:ChbG/HpnK family deacetylase n=1 Tax=uncultured Traorella sp. TaxID=1929048 RepID=UPI0025FCCCEF|nr:ChbG/HpnK family deacetylase [uncultured Traorella sp.]
MKLLVQGDDYGFTKGVTYGIIEAIDHGIITATGMFTNMPIAPWAATFVKERPDFCFGIDFNIVSGPPVSDPAEVPHLVDGNGEFIRSKERLKDPRFQSEKGRREMFPYDEVYKELKAQYDRFVELCGRKPSYLHAHSLGHEHYNEAIQAISQETGIPYSMDLWEKYHFGSVLTMPKEVSKVKKEFNAIDQLNKQPLKNVLDNSDYLLSCDYAFVGGHPGYVDAELLSLTTLSLERCRDLEMLLSEDFKKWIEDNHIELISYKDLK